MKTMQRWTARFVLLVMLVPVFGPLALARVAPAEGMHCMRRSLAAAATASGAEPAMHCHGMQGAGQNEAPPASSQASFHSRDCCCNHDCCRSVTTSEWAQPASRHSSFVCQLIEPALPTLAAARVSSPLIGADSARAPPLS